MMEHEPGLFDRYTDRARAVLAFAEQEAQRFNHNYIGTEHILLGLVREGQGVAAKALDNLGVDLKKVRSAVEFIIGRGERKVTGEIGLTPRARTVLELAKDESDRLGHPYIGTEHILLGLIREGEGIAAGVLESLGVTLERVRSEVIAILTGRNPSTLGARGEGGRYSRPPFNPTGAAWEYVMLEVVEREGKVYIRSLRDLEGDESAEEWLQILEHPPADLRRHALDLLGRSGWEMAGIDPPADSGRGALYIFKRRRR